MAANQKRSYTSDNRDAQAAKTRLRILDAAKELFQREGFDRVTISQLAKASKVSMPTIYSLFKSKRGVLQSLIDTALPPEKFSALVDEFSKEKSPKKRVQMTAKIAREIYDAERGLLDILRSASLVGPELKELEQEREQRRYDRQGDGLKVLMEEGALSKGLTLTQARDIQWALTGRDMYRLFVVELQWTPDEYEAWLAEILIKQLLDPDLEGLCDVPGN